jgi:GNAT superfamily N-acetyltransferase
MSRLQAAGHRCLLDSATRQLPDGRSRGGKDRRCRIGDRRRRDNLNYVSPDARFRGVSRALLAALERRAVERGNAHRTLASTATARRFYLANGYVETGPPRGNFGTQSGFPMRKVRG